MGEQPIANQGDEQTNDTHEEGGTERPHVRMRHVTPHARRAKHTGSSQQRRKHRTRSGRQCRHQHRAQRRRVDEQEGLLLPGRDSVGPQPRREAPDEGEFRQNKDERTPTGIERDPYRQRGEHDDRNERRRQQAAHHPEGGSARRRRYRRPPCRYRPPAETNAPTPTPSGDCTMSDRALPPRPRRQHPQQGEPHPRQHWRTPRRFLDCAGMIE